MVPAQFFAENQNGEHGKDDQGNDLLDDFELGKRKDAEPDPICGHLERVFEKGNALRDCANEALAAMEADGKLKAIEAEWLQTATGAPLIK